MLHRWVFACALVLFGIAGFRLIAGHKPDPRATHLNRISYKTGDQILFVYIGSEDCKFSLVPGFARLIVSARNFVANQAKLDKLPFSTLGVSAGPSAQAGVLYLARFGSFDQISSGRGWLNDSVVHYVWQTLIGDAAVPQILVVRRHVETRDPGYEVSNEKVLVRVLGDGQITQWVGDGAPIH